ncbi:MAG: M24 family metallopeptidase [Hyphomicrobiales bacterium]|nr:M24 family metallopeptidase [Hyphomicrobiales bacterium]
MTRPSDRIEFRISDAELARRWQAVRRVMAERQLDVIIMQSQNDWLGGYVKWFTDLPATNGYPVSVAFYASGAMSVVDMGPLGGRRVFEEPDDLRRGVKLLLTTPAFTSINATSAWHAEALLGDLEHHGVRRLGLLGTGSLPHGFVATLQQGLPNAAFEEACDWLDEIKAIKSPEEQGWIRRVAGLQDQAFAAVLNGIRPGLRDCDIAALAWNEGQRLGSEQGITLASSAVLGQRASFLGRWQQGRRIDKGDHFSILIEVNGPCGYYCELARTIVLGRANTEVLEGFAAMKQAQAHTLSLLKPGVLAADVAAAHDAWMIAHGLPPERRLYAHGQGADMVERPLIRAEETMRLQAGMNLAVHPGYENERLFAVVCDNYLLEPSGASPCLHQTPGQIFELD